MDKLEHFILTNKERFDTAEPPAGLWDNIEKELPREEKKIRPIRFWMSMAAMGAVLFFAGIGVSNTFNKSDEPEFANLPIEIQSEFVEAEKYYQHQVNLKLQKLEQYDQKDEVVKDLDQLDKVYDEMRKELISAQGLDNERVVKTMIDNYRTKVDILEKVLDKLDKIESPQGLKINENERIKI